MRACSYFTTRTLSHRFDLRLNWLGKGASARSFSVPM